MRIRLGLIEYLTNRDRGKNLFGTDVKANLSGTSFSARRNWLRKHGILNPPRDGDVETATERGRRLYRTYGRPDRRK